MLLYIIARRDIGFSHDNKSKMITTGRDAGRYCSGSLGKLEPMVPGARASKITQTREAREDPGGNTGRYDGR